MARYARWAQLGPDESREAWERDRALDFKSLELADKDAKSERERREDGETQQGLEDQRRLDCSLVRFGAGVQSLVYGSSR
jgi:hypothetical protein